jgi:hypothetical protein
MRFLLIFIISLSLFSCVTKKQRARICKECAGKDSVSVEYKERIVKHDTTIYTTIAGPVQWLENPCKNLCDSLGNLKPFKVETKKNGLKSTIKSVGNSIQAECDADSLKQVITLLTKEIERTTFEKKVIPSDCEKEHKTRWDGFTFWWFWITLGIIILFILLKRFKINIPFL